MNAASLDADFRLRRFDAYVGAMWSEFGGGCAHDFLNDSTLATTLGVRSRF